VSSPGERLWLRRIIGLTASVPIIPALGIGNPAAIGPIALVLPLKRDTTRPRWLAPLVLAAIMAASVAYLSSVLHHTTPASALMGHSALFAVSILAFRIIVPDVEAGTHLACWFYVGQFFYALLLLPDGRVYNLGIEGLWKFGIGTSVAVLVTYWAIRLGGSLYLVALALSGMGALSFIVGFRALGVACFAAVLVMAIRTVFIRGSASTRGVVTLGALWALASVLEWAVTSGLFGEDVAYRTATQAEDGGPAILGGRSEPPLSIAAISMRFWTGWGNAQVISSDAIDRGSKIAEKLGMGSATEYLPYWIRYDGFISLHSMALGAWAEGGILAAVFPIGIVALCGAACIHATGKWAPLVTLLSVKTAWDVMFSPWSGNRGIQLAVVAIIALRVLEQQRRERSAEVHEDAHAAGLGNGQ
jgi:hypothetical protein